MFESVDSILGDFTKKVAKLKALQQKHEDKATYLTGILAELDEEREIELVEAKRAATVARKIERLINAEE